MTDPVPSKDQSIRASTDPLYVLQNHEEFHEAFSPILAQAIEWAVDKLRSAPEPAAEWQPIETAPKDGRKFLAIRGGSPFICRWGFEANIWQQDTGEWRDPKYWMPLPARPEQPPRGGQG